MNRYPTELIRGARPWLSRPRPIFDGVVVAVALTLPLFSAAVATPAARGQTFEERVPTGGSNVILRTCSEDGAKLCNEDSDCTGTCAAVNVIDLTANLTVLRCQGDTDDGRNCMFDGDCAGTGTCTAVAGWTPQPGQLTAIKGFFANEVNNDIFDISEGQMCLRNVSIVQDNGAPGAIFQVRASLCDGTDPSEIRTPCVTDADCTGDCRGGISWATGGWGAGGQMLVITNHLERSIVTAHEFMHLAAGVLDEYEGHRDNTIDEDGDNQFDECDEVRTRTRCFGDPNATPCGICDSKSTTPGAPCRFDVNCGKDGICFDDSTLCPTGATCDTIDCIEPTTPNCQTGGADTFRECLMTANGLHDIDTELCWSGNHDPDGDTRQSQCRPNGRSCWDQFAANWPSVIKAPTSTPACDNGPPPPECTVTFFEPDVLARVVAVIDRSASMDAEEGDPPRKRIDVAVDSTKDFVDFLDDGTEFGLASYSDGDATDPAGGSTKDFPGEAGLRELDSDAERSDARAAIDDLADEAGGNTRIGAGLSRATEMLLEDDGQVTLNTAVVLLSDGINNSPTEETARQDLEDALDELLAAGDVQLLVTCIGTGDDVAQSSQCAFIAEKGNGVFVESASAGALGAAFVEFSARLQGKEIAMAEVGTPIREGDLPVTVPVWVESGSSEALFVINWTRPDTELGFELEDPDGLAIDAELVHETSRGRFYRISDPKAGQWTMRVLASLVQVRDVFNAHAIVDHDQLDVEAGLAVHDITWPDGFLVYARPRLAAPILGCDATVEVTKTERSGRTVTNVLVGTFALSDDGDDGDESGQDGTYSLLFKEFTEGAGTYNFDVALACGEAAFYAAGERIEFLDEVPTVGSPPRFRREIRFSGSVSNVPDNLPPIAEICRDVLAECEGATTLVSLDGTCSTDPDGDPLSFRWLPESFFEPPEDISPTPAGSFPLGVNEVSLVVGDGIADSAPDTGLVILKDTVAPEIEIALTPKELWPPNHRMVDVVANVIVEDTCDPAPSVVLTSITSNEPDDAAGNGDGNTVDDVQDADFGTPDFRFRLRAERSAQGDGRTYTVTYTVTDPSGNSATATATVEVPRDRKGKGKK